LEGKEKVTQARGKDTLKKYLSGLVSFQRRGRKKQKGRVIPGNEAISCADGREKKE